MKIRQQSTPLWVIGIPMWVNDENEIVVLTGKKTHINDRILKESVEVAYS